MNLFMCNDENSMWDVRVKNEGMTLRLFNLIMNCRYYNVIMIMRNLTHDITISCIFMSNYFLTKDHIITTSSSGGSTITSRGAVRGSINVDIFIVYRDLLGNFWCELFIDDSGGIFMLLRPCETARAFTKHKLNSANEILSGTEYNVSLDVTVFLLNLKVH